MSPLQESLSKDIVFYMFVKGHLVNYQGRSYKCDFPIIYAIP